MRRGWPLLRRKFLQGVQTFLLHFEIRFDVAVGGDGLFVAEPQGDDWQRDTGLEQVHRGSVTERVEGDFATAQGWARLHRHVERSRQSQRGALPCDGLVVSIGKKVLGRTDLLGLAPIANLSLGERPDRNVKFFAALAVQPDDAVLHLGRF